VLVPVICLAILAVASRRHAWRGAMTGTEGHVAGVADLLVREGLQEPAKSIQPPVPAPQWGQAKSWTGLCLRAAPPAAGRVQGSEFRKVLHGSRIHGAGLVEMRRCDSGTGEQQWSVRGASGQILSYATGLCLAASEAWLSGSRVLLERCRDEPRQKWLYVPGSGAVRMLGGKDGAAWCLDSPGRWQEGSLLQIWKCVDRSPAQQWALGDAPWVPAEPVLTARARALPTACPDNFWPPPAPFKATDHNGVALQDTCFPGRGPNRTNHVFVIGDWGGVLTDKGLNPADKRSKKFVNHRAFVFGADDWAQQKVAGQMAKRALVHEPDYVLNVGDNFYWGGVGTYGTYGNGNGAVCGATPPNVAQPSLQFQRIFEDVYKGPGLDAKKWLGVLGNHDYGGWKFTAAWDQAIGYTWSSQRWMTPAQYWSAKVWYSDFSVDYYFLDTNVADAFTPGSDDSHNVCSLAHNDQNVGCKATGPASLWDCPKWFAKLWADQLDWVEERLEHSTAEWQIVVTHFPPMFMLLNFTNLQAKYGIDLFITGHTHKQEVHGEDEEPAFLNGCPYIISGGGGGITSEGLPSATGDDDMYGFMDLTLSKEEIRIEAISHGGQLRVTKLIHPRLPITTTTTSTGSTSTRTTSTSTVTTSTVTSSSSTTTSSTSSSTTTSTTTTSTTATRTTTITATTTTTITSTVTHSSSTTTETSGTSSTSSSTAEQAAGSSTGAAPQSGGFSWAHFGLPWESFGKPSRESDGAKEGDGAAGAAGGRHGALTFRK